jgi:hypothetical protein
MADYGDFRTAHLAYPKPKRKKGKKGSSIPSLGMKKSPPAPVQRPVRGSLYNKGNTIQTYGGFTKGTGATQSPTPTATRPTTGLKRRTSY